MDPQEKIAATASGNDYKDKYEHTTNSHSGQGETPPSNTLTVLNWDDLPYSERSGTFEAVIAGTVRRFEVSRKTRLLLEGLMRNPIKSASLCRLSEFVQILRDDYHLNIETVRYPSKKRGSSKFGVYFLRTKVRHIAADGEA